jgi:hypothetical protein
MMQLACEGTARRWGGFDHITFYDAKWNTDKTTLDLRDAIMASTAEDPLWILMQGEPDVIGFALDITPKEKHKFVKLVTHHPVNDNSGEYYTWDEMLAFGVEEVRIPDQNINLKLDREEWDWAMNHPDDRIQWVWLMGKMCEVDDVVNFQKGYWDCSDAGMVLYWITGANVNNGLRAGSLDVVKTLLEKYIAENPKKIVTKQPKVVIEE